MTQGPCCFGAPLKYCPPKTKRLSTATKKVWQSTTTTPQKNPQTLSCSSLPYTQAQEPSIRRPVVIHYSVEPFYLHSFFKQQIKTMADNEDDQDLVDYDEEEEEQNVAAEESADAEGKETKK